MEHRSLILDIERGEIKDISIRANLDETYKTLFKNACHAAKLKPKNVGRGMKVVIFGSFWIEAYANGVMKLILNREIDSVSLRKKIWDRLKRLSIQDKFDFFYQISPVNIRQRYKDLKQPIKELFDLRNRLAHFKDEPESMNPVHKGIPIPDINRRLMWSNSQQFSKTVNNVIDWLIKIERQSDKIHKIKSQKIKLSKEEKSIIKSTIGAGLEI